MLRGRVGLSTCLKHYRIRRLCTKRESSRYDETYKKLDFVTAAKHPSRINLGTFSASQLSLEELGEKKRKEEEKKEKEEAERKALEEAAATKSQEELMEMNNRLGKIEEIVLEAKKPSGIAPTKSQGDQSTKLPPKDESKSSKEQKGNVQKNQTNVDSPRPL